MQPLSKQHSFMLYFDVFGGPGEHMWSTLGLLLAPFWLILELWRASGEPLEPSLQNTLNKVRQLVTFGSQMGLLGAPFGAFGSPWGHLLDPIGAPRVAKGGPGGSKA